jgi:ribonucleoside-diphosphate reductase alpha chain
MSEHYSEDQLIQAGLQYFRGDALATTVWKTKYALKSKEGYYLELSPDDTLRRATREIFRIEQKYPNPIPEEEIYSLLKNFNGFIFGGSILFGIGNEEQISSLGNCFFIDNGADSYGGIFNIDEALVQLMKRRGGVGITLEHLRPSSANVNNAAKSSTGAVSFMKRYSESTREVAQDGRRGALMISMHVNHPDIMDFIMAKDDKSKITGANVSVKVTNEFMNAVERDEDYILRWPVESKDTPREILNYNKLYKLHNPLSHETSYVRRVKAREIWNTIIKQAHKNAEPGVLFWDNIINESPADMYKDTGFKTLGTNPCGEIPLSAWDSCRLASINLYTLVENPFTPDAELNWQELIRRTRMGQKFMDDIVDLEEEKIINIIEKIEKDPEPDNLKRTEKETWIKVLEVARNGRRTGMGILGLGDMLAALGIRYGTPEATRLSEDIKKTIAINSYKESVKLAKERGSFPIWNADQEAANSFIRRIISDNFDNAEYNTYATKGRRNISNLAIAPTGTLAIVAQTTSGMEPVFKIYGRRRKKINPNETNVRVDFIDQNGDSWQEYNTIHYPFITWFQMQKTQFTFDDARIFLEELRQEDFEKLIATSPWAGSEALDIDYLEKVKMQGLIQKWVDHSISVTHNLPEKISLKEVNDIYFKAWKEGCKGCTIYREGSRTGVLLSNKKEETNDEIRENNAPKRPEVLPADYFVSTAQGTKFAIIVGFLKDKPFEIFAFENPPSLKNTKGKTIRVGKGHYKFINGEFEIENLQLAASLKQERTLTIAASMLLRHGVSIKHVNKIITKIDDNITSFSSVVRRALSRYIPEEKTEETCPECGQETMVMQEGCKHCTNCGYSRC